MVRCRDRIFRMLFPRNTLRLRGYYLARDGTRIILNEGIFAFVRSIARHLNLNSDYYDYQKWMSRNEPRPDELTSQKEISKKFPFRPRISIITPVWNTDEILLRSALDSVISQTYGNWELCIVDGGSTEPHIRGLLTKYAEQDRRIKVKFLEENRGIAGNSNEALAGATGEYIGFLDHDDEMAPFALHEIVSHLNRNHGLEFIYSDEDKLDHKGKRITPFFKPDWSPDLLLSQNYICHFTVIRKALVDSAGGFRPGYEGSQDYDLFLRCTERILPASIAHIPKILYHWRIIPGSAADRVEVKPYAGSSAKKALTDALERRGETGEVSDGIFSGSFRVRYTIPDEPRVSIIIPTKDHVDFLERCIRSILDKTEYKNFEIVIVDNQSTGKDIHRYFTSLENEPRIRLLQYDKPFNYSAINNYAAGRTDSPFILFLNNDTEVISGEWLSALLEHAQRKPVGAVGAKLLYPDNTIQHAGVLLGITGTPGQKGVAGHACKNKPDYYGGQFLRSQVIGNYSAVTGACLMMRKEVFEAVGGFDENIAIAFNDVDLCIRIRNAGFWIVYTPYSRLYHHESVSRGYEDTPEKQGRFRQEVENIRKKWGAVIDNGDPFYNPNLTLEREDHSIKRGKVQYSGSR